MADASATVAAGRAGGLSLIGGARRLRLLAETAAQHEILTVRGLEGVVQFGDLLAVTAFELGELAGERGDDIAGLVRSGVAAVSGAGLRLGAQLLDALPEGGVAVEEVQ